MEGWEGIDEENKAGRERERVREEEERREKRNYEAGNKELNRIEVK